MLITQNARFTGLLIALLQILPCWIPRLAPGCRELPTQWEDACGGTGRQCRLYQGQVEPPKYHFGQGRETNARQAAPGQHSAPTDSLLPRSCFGKVTVRQVLHFSAGLGVQEEEILQSKIVRERKKALKEEAGCGYRKAYFFKNTSGSYVTLNFSAATLWRSTRFVLSCKGKSESSTINHVLCKLCLRRRCCLSVWYLDWPLPGCGVCLSANPQISSREHSAENQLTRREMKNYLLHCIQPFPPEPHQRHGFVSASHRLTQPSALPAVTQGCSLAQHGSFRPSLHASTAVHAGAGHSHLFDQQMPNLADPHNIPTPVPVYLWRRPFLLAHTGKTWAKPHWSESQTQTQAAHIPAAFHSTSPFPLCYSIPSLKHCRFFSKPSLGRWSRDKDGTAATFVIPRKMQRCFFANCLHCQYLRFSAGAGAFPLLSLPKPFANI